MLAREVHVSGIPFTCYWIPDMHNQAAASHADDTPELQELLDLEFSFAFQPIVKPLTGRVVGHEALLRGVAGERAANIIERIQPHNRFDFDQSARERAIHVASQVGLKGRLHLNCTEVDSDNLRPMLRGTVRAAQEAGIRSDRIVLEFRDLARFGDPRQLAAAGQRCRAAGFHVAADNVGSGEIGLKRLVVFRPDLAKLDRELVAGIHAGRRRQALIAGLIATCRAMGTELVATGVETESEFGWLSEAGIEYFQGFLFAQPTLEKASPEASQGPLYQRP